MTTLAKQIDKALLELVDKYSKIEMKIIEKVNAYIKEHDVSKHDKLEMHSLTLMCSEFDKMIHEEYKAFKSDGRPALAKKKDWERLKKLFKAGYNVLLDEILRLKKIGIEI